MPDYLQALRECCRDEAAFMQLLQILAAIGQNIEETVFERTVECNRQPQSFTNGHSYSNNPPKSIALPLSEERFQKMAANIPGIIFQALHSPDGSCLILFVSSGCRELFGIEPELAQKDISLFWSLIHPDDRAAYQQSVADSVATLQPWRWKGRALTKLGKMIWVQCAASLEQQDNGDILWDGLIMDITPVKQAEEAQRTSEEKFAIAFRSSPDSITITTLSDGRFIDVNDNFLRTSGYTREEVIGHTILELKGWLYREDRLRMQKTLQAQGALHKQEYDFLNKSGKVVSVLFSAEVVNIEGIQCVLAVSTDITERKAAEAQIRATAERDRLLGEIALRIRQSLDINQILNTTVTEIRQFLQADRVFICKFDDSQCRVIAESVDSQWPSIKEWVTDDTASQEIKAIMTGNGIQVINDTMQFPKPPFLEEYHTRYHVKAGIAIPIMLGEQMFGLLIANQCSSTRDWQQLEVDLLEQLATQVAIAIQQSFLFKELAAVNTNLEDQVEERTGQLQQKMQELEKLNQIKDVVLHTMSHELRTSVIGTVMLLKNLLKSPGESVSISRSIVEQMIRGKERQLGTIDSLLETHTSEGQSAVLPTQPIQLSLLLKTIAKELEPFLARSGATLTNHCKADLPLVMADPTQIQRVVEILCTYALKCHPPGLHLTIKAKVDTGMIRCTIQDNGMGMTKIECDRLFDLYIRDPQGKCSTANGIMLYLSRQIIRAHGGQIGVTSAPKRGSTFWFTLPLAMREQGDK